MWSADGGASRVVRAATVDDVEAMLSIYRPIVERTAISFELTAPTAHEFAGRLATVTRRDPWLVCEIGSRVVGYAYASNFRTRPAYAMTRETTIYVEGSAQGQGIGARLLGELLAALAADGIHRAVAGIVPPNPSSIALHERLGFCHVGTFDQVGHKFGRWHDLGFWQRELGAGPV
ncbi:MAG: GNAT family N-acetyltransferase [Acidimicrobiia bacterium]|nr:GNAT family N-acetyltransferase [Acidimicrobiia bacterium]